MGVVTGIPGMDGIAGGAVTITSNFIYTIDCRLVQGLDTLLTLKLTGNLSKITNLSF